MESVGAQRLVRDAGVNAALGWLLVVVVLAASGGAVLAGDVVWAVFAAAVAVIALVPAATLRNARSMPAWEVLLLAAVPVPARLLGTPFGGGRYATYAAVAAVALLVAVDLDAFSPVRMNDGFALLFVVVATMAAAGVWAVVRWLSDLALATTHLGSERALMLEFLASAVVGAVAGIVYVFYFRRRADPRARVPGEVEP